MVVTKITMEICIETRLPKSVIEEIVLNLADKRESFISQYRNLDKDIHARVFYDDFAGVQPVDVRSLMSRFDISRLFRLGRSAYGKKKD